MKSIKVAAGKFVAVTSNGHIAVAKGNDTIAVPKFFAAQLENDGFVAPEEENGGEGGGSGSVE